VRIAVSADSNHGLDSVVAAHFGRCPYFALVDVEDGQIQSVQVIDNPFYARHEPGQVPGFVQGQGAELMIASGMGGRAIEFFRQAGVGVSCGASGTVREAIAAYQAGQLQGAVACRESQEHGHGQGREPH
jgi:predicted Fe-Mo cluster-binding NifX family protein